MGRLKKRQRISDFYKEKTKGIQLENIVLLKLVFHFLPQNIRSKIENFHSFWNKKQQQSEYKDKSPIYILEHDKSLNKELDALINSICKETQLPRKLYLQAITWVILYDRYHRAPATNFLYTRTKNSMILEIFRKPKTADWDMMKMQVELELDKMSHLYNIQIDPRNAGNIDNKLKTIQASSLYDALDAIKGEDVVDGLSKEELKKESQLIRKHRDRFKKMEKKISKS